MPDAASSAIAALFTYLEAKVPPALQDSAAVKTFLHYVKGKTAGQSGDRNNTGFATVFFPEWSPMAGVGADLESVCPCDYGQAIKALLCQAVHGAVEAVQAEMAYDQVTAAVQAVNDAFTACATNLFVYDLRVRLGVPAGTAVAYRSLLLNREWREKTAAQQASGEWKNPSWVMYNHWAKFVACGATDQDVADVYRLLTTEEPKLSLSGLTDIHPDRWRSYAGWRSDPLQGSLLQAQGLGKGYCFLRTSGFRVDGGLKFEEIWGTYAHDYLLTTGWYREPPRCCFAAGTRVVAADGSLKRIEDLRPGDAVASPAGARRVLALAPTARSGRTLHALNGCTARMTATHPVIGAEGDGAAPLFVDPWAAQSLIPTFKTTGARTLRPGARILGHAAGEYTPLDVTEVTAFPPADDGEAADEMVYDLVLAPHGRGCDCYVAGDERMQFVVGSEAPSPERFPLATQAFAVLLDACDAVLSDLHQRLGPAGFQARLEQVVRSAAPRMLAGTAGAASGVADASDFTEILEWLWSPEHRHRGLTAGILVSLMATSVAARLEFPDHGATAAPEGGLAVCVPFVWTLPNARMPEDGGAELRLEAGDEVWTLAERAPDAAASSVCRRFGGTVVLHGMPSSLTLTLVCGSQEWRGTVALSADGEGNAPALRTAHLFDCDHREVLHAAVLVEQGTPAAARRLLRDAAPAPSGPVQLGRQAGTVLAQALADRFDAG